MSLISRQDFLNKVNSALNEGKKLLVGKEEGKGGGGRPVVFLKDEKLEWYIDTLKKDATSRFGDVEKIIQRDATGKLISIDSSLFEKIISTTTAVLPIMNKQVATIIEEPKKKAGRPRKTEVKAVESTTEKKKPGRPAKVKTAAETTEITVQEKSENTVDVVKRGPGRPKATPSVAAAVTSTPVSSATQVLGSLDLDTLSLAFRIVSEMNKTPWKKSAVLSIIDSK